MEPAVRFILFCLFVVFVLFSVVNILFTVVNILLLLIALFLCFVLVAYPFLKRALRERERRSDQLQVKSKKNRQKRKCFPPNSKLKVKRHVYEVSGDGNFKFLVRNNDRVSKFALTMEDWNDVNEKLSECSKKWPRGFKHKPGGTMRIDEQGIINKDINGNIYRFVNVQVQKNIKRRRKRRGDPESTTVALVLIPFSYQVCFEYVLAAINYSLRTHREVIICPQETQHMEIESQVPSYIK